MTKITHNAFAAAAPRPLKTQPRGVMSPEEVRAVLATATQIDPAAQAMQMKLVTILVHKPVGFVSGQAEDGYEPAVTLVKPENHWDGDHTDTRFSVAHLRQLAPAGRLDIDSTGLLVLTQDGRIARQLIGEDSDVEKEYLVRVNFGNVAMDVQQAFPPDQLARLRHLLRSEDVWNLEEHVKPRN